MNEEFDSLTSRSGKDSSEIKTEIKNSSSKRSIVNKESPTVANPVEVKSKRQIGTLKNLKDSQEYEILNPYLTEGYRLGYKRFRDIFKTLFMWHNETLNIWTHLVGAIFMIAMAVWFANNYDRCYQKYTEMSVQIVNIHHDYSSRFFNVGESFQSVLDTEFLNMEKFSSALSKVKGELNDVKSALAQKLLISVNQLIDCKDDLKKFVVDFASNIGSRKWMNEFAVYHKLLITIENSITSLQGQLEETSLDFEKMLWIRTLAKYMPIREVHQNLPVWPIVFYLLTATFCLGASACYHWFYIQSAFVYKIMGRMDLSGIVVLIFGSVFPIIFYTFYCQKVLIFCYTIFYGTVCTITFFVSLTDWFNADEQRGVKGIIYGGVGICAGMISLHAGIQG